MAKPNLRLARTDEPTRVEIAMVQVDQSHREWAGPNGLPWKPFTESRERPALDVDGIQAKSYKVIITDAPVPRTRMLLRFITRILIGQTS